MEKSIRFEPKNENLFRIQLLNYINLNSSGLLLETLASGANTPENSGDNYQLLAAIANQNKTINKQNNLTSTILDKKWWFGFITYELKNKLENLYSKNPLTIHLPELHFFSPSFIIIKKNNQWHLIYNSKNNSQQEASEKIKEIEAIEIKTQETKSSIDIKNRQSKDEYLDAINKIKDHIHRGDIYEMNYCMEFYSKEAIINPIDTYLQLSSTSPVPFAAFLKFNDIYLISASPERFLLKKNSKLISQPIKGTCARSSSKKNDLIAKHNLQNNPKERSENIMITDMVRNDLSRIAVKGSVNVDELCEVYSFKQVHQMISTISAISDPQFEIKDIIKNTFPIGSMTGAPKIKAMEIIDEYETQQRGLYSGAVGYIDPEGNFDFNVVIRSIVYDSRSNYLSFMAGSAITALSDPEMEYDECLLKAAAIRTILTQNNSEPC